MTIRFLNLVALHWLWAVALLGALAGVGLVLQRRRLLRFAQAALMARLTPTASTSRSVIRVALLLAALVALVAAMIDPRWGVRYEEVRQQGIDLVVCLDVSRSMLAEDAAPSRLVRAKQQINDLLEQLSGDRVALITFAGAAAIRCPLTVDYGAVRMTLDEVGPESSARGGSLLGDALRLAEEAFTDELPEHKIVLVLTDGEDHGSYPVEAARRLFEERGVRVYTVGIGDDLDGARIPVEVDGQQVYLTHEGQEVWSKMDGTVLRDIALTAGGAYIPARTQLLDMGMVYRERIEPATKREFDTARIQRYNVQYQWFAGIALALLLVESCIGARRAPRRGVVPAFPEASA